MSWFVIVFCSINDYEFCVELLLDIFGDEIGNLCDEKDSYDIIWNLRYNIVDG